MRPRSEVAFLSADQLLTDAAAEVRDLPHSRYPVIGENFDEVLGLLHVRDLLQVTPEDTRTVGEVRREILMLPGTNRLLPAVSLMRESGTHLAVVVDEYGGTDGIVTLEDLVEEILGDIRDEYDDEPPAVGTGAAAGVVAGGLTIEDFSEQTGVELVDGDYETVAGYVVARLGRIPEVGDAVEVDGTRLEVADMAGRRVTGVLVVPEPAAVDASVATERD